MNNRLESDLQRVFDIISDNWRIQNNYGDRATSFIYRVNSLEECLVEIEARGVDKQYALHRWYNYMTSIQCEKIFCECGAIHDDNVCNQGVDIYIKEIPFDVKLTVYPAKLSSKPYDLTTRTGKNEMIRWYYAHQSQQGRKQLLNRLYVVCDASTSKEALRMKSDFALMRTKISSFMSWVSTNGINQIEIQDGGVTHCLYSDLIYLV